MITSELTKRLNNAGWPLLLTSGDSLGSVHIPLDGGEIIAVNRSCVDILGAIGEAIISEKLDKLGILHTPTKRGAPYDFLLSNGNRIDVKSSCPTDGRYMFNVNKTRKGDYCDYVILCLLDRMEFFVIPIEDAPPSTLNMRYPSARFNDYINRFDLLILTLDK